MAYDEKIAAIMGHKAYLYGHKRYIQGLPANHEELLGRPGASLRPDLEALRWVPGSLQARIMEGGKIKIVRRRDHEHNAKLLAGHWVYVFLYDGRPESVRLFAELRVDAGTGGAALRVQLNPLGDTDQRLSWPDELGAVVSDDYKPELPRSAGGRKLYHLLIGTPFRLTDACLAKLVKNGKIAELVPAVDRDSDLVDETLTSDVAGHTVRHEKGIAVPVLLPIDVAVQLASDVKAAQRGRAKAAGLDPSAKGAAAARRDVQKYHVARTLHALRKHPDFGSKVTTKLSAAKLSQMEIFRQTHERIQKKHAVWCETLGVELARWFDREIVQILLDGAVRDDARIVIEAMAEISAGLEQTSAGVVCLARYCGPKSADSFVRRNFDGPLTDDGKAMLTDSGKSFAKVFAAVQMAKIAHFDPKADAVLQGLENVFGSVIKDWKAADFDVKVATLEQYSMRTKLRPSSGAAEIRLIEAQVLSYRAAGIERLGKVVGGVDFAFKVLDSINFAIAVKQYVDTDPNDIKGRTRKLVELGATGGDLLASFLDTVFDHVGRDNVWKSARIGVRSLGFIAAILSVGLSTRTVLDAWAMGDYDAAVFEGAAAGTSVVSAVVSAVATAGESASFGWMGLALGVAAGVLHVAYLYCKDSDVETFALLCHWGPGVRSSEDLAEKPGWLTVPAASLANDWDAQCIALAAMQRQFAVEVGNKVSRDGREVDFRNVRIYVGHVDADTRFEVTWRWKPASGGNEQHHKTIWTMTPLAKVPKGADEIGGFGERLMTTAKTEPNFEAPIPDKALSAGNVFGTGALGFEYLRVEVSKTYEELTSRRSLPPKGPLKIEVKVGAKTPDLGKKKTSIA